MVVAKTKENATIKISMAKTNHFDTNLSLILIKNLFIIGLGINSNVYKNARSFKFTFFEA
jgi:hypothetical protein